MNCGHMISKQGCRVRGFGGGSVPFKKLKVLGAQPPSSEHMFGWVNS